jgi:hypothetical protein
VTDGELVVNPTDVSAKVLDGEAVIINLSTGVYFSATGSGALAWALLQAGHDRSGIARGVAERFGAPIDQVDADLAPFLDELVARDLAVAGTPPDSPAAVDADIPDGPYAPPVLEAYTDMADLLALDPPMPGLSDIPWSGPDATS